MSKKIKLIMIASVISLIAFTVLIAVAPKHGYSINMNPLVEVKDSKASPEYNTYNVQKIKLNANGTYILKADWSDNEMPGFITGLTLTDEAGKTLYSISGGLLSFDTEPIRLKAGNYTIRLEYLCNVDSYNAFQRENSLKEGSVDESWFRDGTWHMSYRISVKEGSKATDAVMVCCGVVIAAMLIFTIITVATDDSSGKHKYDERQIAMQGKAYKLGFFTTIAVNMGLMTFSGYLGNFAEIGVYMLLSVFVGVCVTLTNLIMNDAYFRLGENKALFLVVVALFAAINLGLGIRNILTGSIFTNGVLSFAGTANFILGLMIVYIFIILLVKKVKDSREAADEES